MKTVYKRKVSGVSKQREHKNDHTFYFSSMEGGSS